jgi:hypothetical protein
LTVASKWRYPALRLDSVIVFVHSTSGGRCGVTVLDWNQRVVPISEVGQAHDGSPGTAHALVDAIVDADAGADAVKFQRTSLPRKAGLTNPGG